MDTIFLLCAIIGGTILLLQFAMTVLGLGGDHGDAGGDTGLDVGGHDFSGDMHHDVGSHDAGHDGGGHDGGSHDGGSHDGGSHDGSGHNGSAHDSNAGDHVQHQPQQSTVWFFRVITFQTLVASVAFFGLAGKAAQAAQLPDVTSLVIALGAGVAAMYGVYYLIRGLHQFNADGTVQIGRSLGRSGTVYIPIPASNAGAGKIQMTLQNRIVELQAMTASDRLPSGAKVRVVGIIGPDTVAVERFIEAEIKIHA